MSENKQTFPPQQQARRPGLESVMDPEPQTEASYYRGAGKLAGKVALITGGDSGIGKATAILFAREGANVGILYKDEHEDAKEAQKEVKQEGVECILIAGDIGDEDFCRQAVKQVVEQFGGLDILVNNAGEQHPQDSIEDISAEQLERTFRTNIFACFYLVKAALNHMPPGSTIINTTSVTAYRGSPHLLDYSSTKGAIVSFTRSLSIMLQDKQIRVNAVAPGPIWTPLIPSTFSEDKVKSFGADTPMARAGQPEEVAPCFVFLASQDSSYISGQVLHPNGGEIING